MRVDGEERVNRMECEAKMTKRSEEESVSTGRGKIEGDTHQGKKQMTRDPTPSFVE